MPHDNGCSGTDSSQHWKGWYSSGSYPHRDLPSTYQFITFRLADSLPQSVLRGLEAEVKKMPQSKQKSYKRKRIEQWLDAGLGCCALAHPGMAEAMKETLIHYDGRRYRLIAWCIMPNHVHVLIRPDYSLPRIVQAWKSYTTRWMLLHNERLGLGVSGRSLWMRDYWDRFIRDELHFDTAISYIHQNPVKAGLCDAVEDWRWSSAFGVGGPQA